MYYVEYAHRADFWEFVPVIPQKIPAARKGMKDILKSQFCSYFT